MNKLILIIFATFFSITSLAAEYCPAEAADIAELIESKKTCYQAAKVARDCAWGSSIDVSFTGLASAKCTENISTWPERHRQLREELTGMCWEKYDPSHGTLAKAIAAHCSLDVDVWFQNLNESDL